MTLPVTPEMAGDDPFAAIPMGPDGAVEAAVETPEALPDEQAQFVAYVRELVPLPQDGEQDEDAQERLQAIEAMYGDGCPLVNPAPSEDDFVWWADVLWDEHAEAHEMAVLDVQRYRNFRDGRHWLSRNGKGPWREPPRPKDSVRAVINMIGPALDWRLQVLSEQRPGARVRPVNQLDPDDLKRAQATTYALEYHHTAQNMAAIIREAAYFAQTDGVSFLHVYWDADAGPWHERGKGRPKGDVRTCVERIEQVRVSANATATQPPLYWVVRKTIPTQEAIAKYGQEVVGEGDGSRSRRGLVGDRISGTTDYLRDITSPLSVNDRFMGTETVTHTTVYIEPSRYLPDGLHFIVVGRKLVYLNTLLVGRVPLVRFTDGSSDPAFYPKPVMSEWCEPNMRLNAVYSKLIENIRRNAGGRLLARPNAVAQETLTGASDTLIEVRSPGPISEAVQAMSGFSIGSDAMQVIQMEISRLEDLTGYNEVARGGMSANASGRAILAVREQLERVFAPGIYAASEAYKGWAELTCAFMAWGYEMPRSIAIAGKSRPDLAAALTRDDIDGGADIELDPEVMFPMPRSLKIFLLDDLLQKGLIQPDEYRRRLPFAFVNELHTPNALQEAAAMRVVEALRAGRPAPPIRWQTNEAIEQDVLEREIIFAPDAPEALVEQANQRWMQLAQQAQMKQGGMASPGGAPDGGARGLSMPPQTAPTLALPNGAVAAEPLMLEQTQQSQAAKMFENVSPQ